MIPLYSWPTYREPCGLEVTELSVDGSPRPDLVDTDHRRLRADHASAWRIVSFKVSATVPEARGVPSPQTVHLLVAAARAQTRMPIPLTSTADGTWVARVELPREIVAGTVILVAEATARVDGRVRLLGRSDEWTLVVDPGESPVPPGAPPFPMVWLDFTGPDAPEAARRSPDAHAVMDMSISPTLYLNDGIEGLRGLLHADTARGERRRARDLFGADVARQAMATLMRAAAADLATAAGDEDALPPADPLLRQSLEAVAKAMRSTADLSDLCHRIARAENGPVTERLALWTEIDAAVARLCGLPEMVASIAKEARNA